MYAPKQHIHQGIVVRSRWLTQLPLKTLNEFTYTIQQPWLLCTSAPCAFVLFLDWIWVHQIHFKDFLCLCFSFFWAFSLHLIFFHRNFDQKRENYKFSRSNLQFVRILLRATARFRLSLHNVYVHASSVCVRNKESDGDNFHVSRVLCMLLLLHSVYVYTTSTRTMAWKENQYWLRARFLSASFGRSFACLLACFKSNWAHVNELAQQMTPKSFPFPWSSTFSFVVG